MGTNGIAQMAPDESLDKLIRDEVQRYRVRKVIEEPRQASPFTKFCSSPLTLLLLGFSLTTVVGSYITYRYNSGQARVQHERSFADEINKTRVNRIGEVWQKVDVYDARVGSLTQQMTVTPPQTPGESPRIEIPNSQQRAVAERFEQNVRLHEELLGVLDQNRFWLGEPLYKEIKNYAETSYEYSIALKQGGQTELVEERRRKSRTELDQIRERMLNGDI